MTSTRQWVVAAVQFPRRRFAAALVCAWLSGCASGPVQRGTVIGALAGAAAGTGVGLLISDASLLGSSKQSQIELERGSAVGAGAVIGVVFGAIVGAMIGHGNEDKFPPPPSVPAAPTAAEGASGDVQARVGQVPSVF